VPGPKPHNPQEKRTFLKVFLALCAFGVVGIIALVAVLSAGANHVANSIKADENKPGGSNNPVSITVGKAFDVDGLTYANGWTIANDGMGDATVKHLKVTNNRDQKDSAVVEIKLWKGNEVRALLDCTSNPMDVGTTVQLSCFGTDPLPKTYDRVTIDDSF